MNLSFYAVVDAAGWPVEARYLLVNHALLPFIVCDAISLLLGFASGAVTDPSRPGPPTREP